MADMPRRAISHPAIASSSSALATTSYALLPTDEPHTSTHSAGNINCGRSHSQSANGMSFWTSSEEERMLLQRVEQAAEVAALNAIGRRGHVSLDMPEASETERSLQETDDEEAHEQQGGAAENNGENNVESAPELLRREFTRLRLAWSQNRNAQTVAYMFSAFLPFALLFLCKLVYEKRLSFTTFFWSYFCFLVADKNVVAVSNNQKGSLILTLFFVVLNYLTIHFVLNFDLSIIYNGLTFRFGTYLPCFTTLYYVLMADIAAKNATVLLKAILISLPSINMKRRRRLLQFTEYLSQLYRCCMAAPRWFMYFSSPLVLATTVATELAITVMEEAPIENGQKVSLVDTILVIFYISLKVRECIDYFRLLAKSFTSLLNLVSYGVPPTAEEVAKDPKCSICYEQMRCPIKLACNHIFCEECAEKWLDEKHTCPMCRTQVEEQDSSWFNAATCKTVRCY